jgi:putative resolvase
MKLSAWAKKQGICYKTAWRLYSTGRFPLPTEQLPTGTIIVKEPDEDKGADNSQAVIYARVSSSDQKQDLDRQVSRLVEYALSNGYSVKGVVKETGSGLNGRGTKLLSVLRDSSARIIIVEHKDRLARFGFEYIEALLASSGRRVAVADDKEMTDDLVQDMIDVLTLFCARLYGKRSAKNKAKKAMKAMEG